jgi:hypothetical protein
MLSNAKSMALSACLACTCAGTAGHKKVTHRALVMHFVHGSSHDEASV